jgi:AcrR family transcriptional regulator
MPRAFTEAERTRIRTKLMEAGRSCFLRYGPRKTTLDDLVGPAGIAKASFYLFFESKEALFVDLMLEEMPAMMHRLLAASFDRSENARDALVLLMHAIVHEIETNELSRILLDDRSEMERLAAGMDFERVLQQSASMFKPLLQRIVDAQERGEIIQGDPLQISYSLGLIKLLPVNKDRIPESLYDSLMAFAPSVIADGLTCPARTARAEGAAPQPDIPEHASPEEG